MTILQYGWVELSMNRDIWRHEKGTESQRDGERPCAARRAAIRNVSGVVTTRASICGSQRSRPPDHLTLIPALYMSCGEHSIQFLLSRAFIAASNPDCAVEKEVETHLHTEKRTQIPGQPPHLQLPPPPSKYSTYPPTQHPTSSPPSSTPSPTSSSPHPAAPSQAPATSPSRPPPSP